MMYSPKTLGKRGSKLLLTLSSQNKDVFTLSDAQKVLKDLNPATLRKLLSRLVEKGWLKRLKGGKYLIVPLEAGPEGKWSEEAFVIVSYLTTSYAIAYWSALSYYGYTEQIARTIFVATPKRRPVSEIKVLGVPYKFITLKKHKFFGVDKVWVGGKEVNITDKEKTILDCLDHPEYCGGITEAAKGLSNAFEEGIDLERLTNYATRMENKTIFKRLGYLAEILDLPVPKNYLNEWKRNISKGYSLLDPSAGKRGKHNSNWNLTINVEEKELTSFKAY